MTTIGGPGPTEYRFFWHAELAHCTSEEDARAFAERREGHPAVADGWRGLLWPDASLSDENQSGEDQVRRVMARLRASGQLIAERSFDATFKPMWQQNAAFPDFTFAFHFLSRFRSDPIALAKFRGLLQEHNPGRNLSRLTADQVTASVANLPARGKLIPGFRVNAATERATGAARQA